MTVAGFIGVYGDGSEAHIDAQEDSIAFACPSCGHPVLAIASEQQRGFSTDNPAKCNGCGEQFVLDVREQMEKVIIFRFKEYGV